MNMDEMEEFEFDHPLNQLTVVKMSVMRKRETRKVTDHHQHEHHEKHQVMDLSGMSLDSLPKPPLDLSIISKLDLSNNNLQIIPESLTARLLNLEELDVHSNQLRTLPNSIGCLFKLKVLNVSGNYIESLPIAIENCRSLEELNVNFNKLVKLPDTMGFELIKLKKLAVNSNLLMFLPMSTSHLTALKVLDARLNCLRSLPEDLENLINLEILNVSQNFQYLNSLPSSIGLLLSLIELDVSYNSITTLPDSIGCLSKLERLSVEGNPLSSPPPEVVEQGLHVVKEYMCHKMNSAHQTPKKKSWMGKLVKWGTFNGHMKGRKQADHKGFSKLQYQPMNGLASPGPGFMGKLSPLRLFSPRRSFG